MTIVVDGALSLAGDSGHRLHYDILSKVAGLYGMQDKLALCALQECR